MNTNHLTRKLSLALATPATLALILSSCSGGSGQSTPESTSASSSPGLAASSSHNHPSSTSEAVKTPVRDRDALVSLLKNDAPSIPASKYDDAVAMFGGLCDVLKVNTADGDEDKITQGIIKVGEKHPDLINDIDGDTIGMGMLAYCPSDFSAIFEKHPDLLNGYTDDSGPSDSGESGEDSFSSSASEHGVLSFGQESFASPSGVTVTVGQPKRATPSPTAYSDDHATSGGRVAYTVKVSFSVDADAAPFDPDDLVIYATAGESEAPQWYDDDQNVGGPLSAAKVMPDHHFSFEVGVYAKPGSDVTVQIDALSELGELGTWTGPVK